MTLNMWFGLSMFVISAVWFPSALVYGLVRGRVFNLFGADLWLGLLRRAAGAPPAPLVVSRSQHPVAYWVVITFYAVMSLLVLFLVYAYLFLQPAPVSPGR